MAEGIVHHQALRLGEAISCYSRVVGTLPEYGEAWRLLGIVALQSGDSEAARSLLKRAIQIDAKDAAAYSGLGSVYEFEGKFEEARTAYATACATDVTQSVAVIGFIRTALRLDRASEAVGFGEVMVGRGNVDVAVFDALRAARLAVRDSVATAETFARTTQLADDEAIQVQKQSAKRALKAVRSLAAQGSVDRAHEALRSLVTNHLVPAGAEYSFLQDVVFTAFDIADLPTIENVVASHFIGLSGCRLSISSDDPPNAETIRWEARKDGSHRFTFRASLFTCPADYMYTIVTRWLACLPIVSCYDGTSRPAGSCYLQVGDQSDGLGLCFSDNRPDALLIPDSSFLLSNGYAETRAAFAIHAISWADRLPVALWRGSSTGLGTRSLMETPRALLCRLALESGAVQLLDAGITDVVQASTPEDAEALRHSGFCRPHVPMAHHVRYKYHVDIDGNTNSWPGLFQKLLTGSPVLKVQSPGHLRQWYYPRLIPWQNYIPIASDMSDLIEIISYLKRNDDLAFTIGAAGRRLTQDMTCEAELAACLPTVEGAFRRDAFVSERTAT